MDMNDIRVSALIDFEMLVNVDYGIIKLIKRDYNNGEYIDLDYLDKVKDSVLISELYLRDYENPLELVLKDDYINQADGLLNQIYKEKYKDVLDLSVMTNVSSLMQMYTNGQYMSNDEFSVTVLCKNLIEEHYIKLKNPEYNTLVVSDKKKVDVNMYDYFYIKNFKDLLDYNRLLKKNLYIARYGFNREPGRVNTLKLSISEKLADFNQLFFIDIYSIGDIKG